MSDKEFFINAKTNYIVTNNPNRSSNTSLKYARANTEYPIAFKNKNTEIAYDYLYIRAPANRYISIYIKRADENDNSLISTTLIKLTNDNINIPNLFKSNNLILSDNNFNYKYFIKFLTDNEYQNELQKQNELQDVQRRYDACVNLSKKTTSLANSQEKCSREFRI